MNNKKIWTIKGDQETYTDEELIQMIKDGLLKEKTKIICKEMKDYIMIKDSVYEFYLREGNKDETI